MGDAETNFLISTDSLSSLMTLLKFDVYNYLFLEIIEKLSSSNKNYFINWVKCHSEIQGNELNDQLARSTTEDETMPLTFLPLPSSTLKLELKRRPQEKRQ